MPENEQFKRDEIDRLKKLLQAVDASAGGSPAEADPIVWWDDFDVMRFLRISRRTLERRRQEKKIEFHKFGSRCYYIPENIYNLRYSHLK